MKRFFYIDFLKAFGIILVVFGHVYQVHDNFYYFIYSFHMPLFFLLSGVFFKYGISIKELLKKRINSMLIPYIFFYIVTYLYWLFIERNMRAESGGVSTEWWKPIIGLFVESPNHNFMAHNNPLWFIPSLFSIEIMACYLTKKVQKSKLYIVSLLLLLLSTLWSTLHITLPFGLVMACCCFTFFILGHEIQFMNNIKQLSKQYYILLFLFIISFIYINKWGGYATNFSLFNPNIKYIFHFYMMALYMIAFSIVTVKCIEPYISKISIISKCISFIGTNTLIILCLHDPLKRAVIFLFSKLTETSMIDIRQDLLLSSYCVIIIFILLVPIITIYNKWIVPILKKQVIL